MSVTAAAMLLTGCGALLPEPPVAPRAFDFGPTPALPDSYEAGGIELAGVRAPTWMQSDRIHYRLLHEQAGARREYANSVWVAVPAELIEHRLRHRLAALSAVSGGRSRLALELVTFEQVFERPESAYVVIEAIATLDGQGTPTRRGFSFRRDSSPDVGGATRELPVVADRLVEEVARWAQETATARGATQR